LFIVFQRSPLETFEDLAADLVKPYKVNDKTVNQAFELKHGKSIRLFLMDKVSNAEFHPVGVILHRITARFSVSYRKNSNVLSKSAPQRK
jgi:Plus-3 domain